MQWKRPTSRSMILSQDDNSVDIQTCFCLCLFAADAARLHVVAVARKFNDSVSLVYFESPHSLSMFPVLMYNVCFFILLLFLPKDTLALSCRLVCVCVNVYV